MPVLGGCDGLYVSRRGVCSDASHGLPKETPEGRGTGAQLMARCKQRSCRGLPVLHTEALVRTRPTHRPG